MKCSWNNIELGWCCGDIASMLEEAIMIADMLDTKVSFKFNGVVVNVTKHSSLNMLDEVIFAVKSKKPSVFGKGW